MPRGPVKRPTSLETKLGNPGRRKRAQKPSSDSRNVPQAAEAEAPVAEQDISPPDWLTDNGRKVWSVVAPDLALRQVLKASDVLSLARYCDFFALWLELRNGLLGRRKTMKVTYTAFTQHGSRKLVEPNFRAMREVGRELRDFEDRFGLNPSMRTSLMSRIAEARDPQKPPLAPTGKSGAKPKDGVPPAPPSPLNLLGGRRPLN
jgi:P27 family predicted phage terminase small subunit